MSLRKPFRTPPPRVGPYYRAQRRRAHLSHAAKVIAAAAAGGVLVGALSAPPVRQQIAAVAVTFGVVRARAPQPGDHWRAVMMHVRPVPHRSMPASPATATEWTATATASPASPTAAGSSSRDAHFPSAGTFGRPSNELSLLRFKVFVEFTRLKPYPVDTSMFVAVL